MGVHSDGRVHSNSGGMKQLGPHGDALQMAQTMVRGSPPRTRTAVHTPAQVLHKCNHSCANTHATSLSACQLSVPSVGCSRCGDWPADNAVARQASLNAQQSSGHHQQGGGGGQQQHQQQQQQLQLQQQQQQLQQQFQQRQQQQDGGGGPQGQVPPHILPVPRLSSGSPRVGLPSGGPPASEQVRVRHLFSACSKRVENKMVQMDQNTLSIVSTILVQCVCNACPTSSSSSSSISPPSDG